MTIDDFALKGIEWWNSLTEDQRAFWLAQAFSASPADAYRKYLETQGRRV